MKVHALIAILALGLTSCSSAPRQPRGDDLRIIDAHTHTEFTGGLEPFSKIPRTEAEYFKEWKEAGIVGAVSHTGRHQENWHDLHDRNVIMCAGTDNHVNVPVIEAGLKSGKFRCIKIYLGYVHEWAYSPAYEPAYRLAEKYHVPVVFHTGDTYDPDGLVKYADPLTIDQVAVKHRKVNFVIAHCGNPWIESAAEVAYKNKNVFLDGSAFLIGDMDAEPPGKVDEYVVKPLAWVFGYLEEPTKLMYGSDWPLNKMKPYVDAFKRAIPPEHWQAVFHDNAVRVFGLKP